MKPKKKKFDWEKVVFWIVLATLFLSAIYSGIKAILAPSGAIPPIQYDKVRSDYVLMFLQCILGIIVMFLPSIIERELRIDIPSYMHIAFVIFLYCAIYLGEIRSFYYKFQYWDLVLHCFSALMLGAIGFSVVSILNGAERIKINLSPLFVALFAFNFALTMGVLWEFHEFLADGAFGLNMQKFAYESGKLMAGREALTDTMQDLIVDAIGAFIMASVGYISLKYKKSWIDQALFEVGNNNSKK
jgi:hypothetical protein